MRKSFSQSAAVAVIAGLIAACSASPGTSTTVAPPSPSMAASSAASAPAAAASANADLLADIDVGGGRTMHILCVGPTDTGKPTIVFESGLGGDAGQWSDVIHGLAGSYRACAYDRAGNGQSPAAAVGRTTKDQVADLRALLTAAEVKPPYLLVGFSIGGWNAMVHNDAHPADVVGAVMVDVRPPAASKRQLAALPPQSATESEAIKAAREESTIFDTDPSLNPEGLKLGVSAEQAIATKGFGDKPLIVLAPSDTAYITEGFDAAQGAKMQAIYWELQDDLVSLSSKGRLVKVDNTEHEIPIDRPDAVVDAIREVLGG